MLKYAQDLKPGERVLMKDGTFETIGSIEFDDDEMVSVDYETGSVSVLPRMTPVRVQDVVIEMHRELTGIAGADKLHPHTCNGWGLHPFDCQ